MWSPLIIVSPDCVHHHKVRRSTIGVRKRECKRQMINMAECVIRTAASVPVMNFLCCGYSLFSCLVNYQWHQNQSNIFINLIGFFVFSVLCHSCLWSGCCAAAHWLPAQLCWWHHQACWRSEGDQLIWSRLDPVVWKGSFSAWMFLVWKTSRRFFSSSSPRRLAWDPADLSSRGQSCRLPPSLPVAECIRCHSASCPVFECMFPCNCVIKTDDVWTI